MNEKIRNIQGSDFHLGDSDERVPEDFGFAGIENRENRLRGRVRQFSGTSGLKPEP